MLFTNEFKFKLNLHKSYFEKGFGILNYIKYFILVFGAQSFATGISMWITGILFFIFFVVCYIVGWIWFNFGWFEQEIEVSNQFNCFVKEMREKVICTKNL